MTAGMGMDKVQAAFGGKVLNKILHPLSQEKHSHRTPSADAAGTQTDCMPPTDWLNGNYYLRIIIKEGRNLANTKDSETNPFVRVSIGDETTANVEESTTRVCYHNTQPMWEDSLLFPIQSRAPDTPVVMSVLDRESRRTTLLGQVTRSLGALLAPIQRINEEVTQWRALTRRKSPSDGDCGDLCFSVTVVDQPAFVKLFYDVAHQLDPSTLNERLCEDQLSLVLHDIRGLPSSLGPLSLEVRIGRSTIRRPIVCKNVPPADGVPQGTSVNTLDQVVVISLCKAFKKGIIIPGIHDEDSTQAAIARGFQDMMNHMVEASTMVGTNPYKRNKEKHEFGDIKIYVKNGRDIVAKTQIPIWTVPYKNEEPPLAVVESAASAPTHGGTHHFLKKILAPLAPHENGHTHTPMATAPSSITSFTSISSEQVATPRSAPNAEAATDPAVPSAALGHCYTRVMESYRKDLGAPLDLVVSLQLQSKEEVSNSPTAEAETLEDSEDDEDVSDPPAYTPPPDLETSVAEAVIGCGPNKLWLLLWKADSETLKRIADTEKLKNMEVGPWALDPVSKLRVRTTTYVKPLNINIPFVPKEAPCVVLVTVQSKEDGGWCVTQKIQTKAPQGDAFFVIMQWVGVHLGVNKTRLKITMKVEFVRSIMTKSIIISQSTADSRRFLEVVLRIVREQVGDPSSTAEDALAVTAGAVEQASQASTLRLEVLLAVLTVVLLLIFLVLWRLSAATTRSSDKVVEALHVLGQNVVEAFRVLGQRPAGTDLALADTLRDLMREYQASSAGAGALQGHTEV